jgi:hypothetical protein
MSTDCSCGVCQMLAECRRPVQTSQQQIADPAMLTNLADFCDNLFNDDPTRSPLPALSPLHETFRSNIWGPNVWRKSR